MEGSQKNRIMLFGEGIARVCKDIADSRQGPRGFSMKPIGPIGMHIDVKDKRYLTAVESALSQNLDSFVCANHEDRKKLEQLAQKHQQRVQCVVMECDQPRHQTRKHNFGPGSSTIEDMLTIENPIIANALIDQAEIERLVLAENRDHAVNILRSQQGRSAKNIYIPDGMRISSKGGHESFIQYHQRGAPKLADADPARLQHLKQQQSQLQAQREQFKEEADKKAHEKGHLEHQCKEATRQRKQIEKELKELTSKVQDQEQRLKDMGTGENEIDDQIAEIENEIEEADAQVEQDTAELRKAQEQLDEIKTELIAKQKEVQAVKAGHTGDGAMAALDAKLHEIKANDKNFKVQLKEMTEYQTNTARKRAEMMQRLETEQREVEDGLVQTPAYCRQMLQGQDDVAEHFTERPDYSEYTKEENSTAQKIWACVEVLTRRMEREGEKKTKEEIKAIESAHRAAKAAYETLKRRQVESENQTETMRASLNLRVEKQKKFQKDTAKKTSGWFSSYMKTRGHKGKINTNFKNQTLDFDVTMKGSQESAKKNKDGEPPSKKQKTKTDTKTLSGGERAFTTVAFLMALGEAMECPFRGMDEFDCFMDAANRNVSIDQLITFAKDQGHRQFLFLTPLSVTGKMLEEIQGGESTNVSIYNIKPKRESARGDQEDDNL